MAESVAYAMPPISEKPHRLFAGPLETCDGNDASAQSTLSKSASDNPELSDHLIHRGPSQWIRMCHVIDKGLHEAEALLVLYTQVRIAWSAECG
jgi:hypothetical protein